MTALEVRPYRPELSDVWDRFVENSRNGTFQLQRPYMEYHADRFQDHSLVVSSGEKILTLLPANRVDSSLHSHAGLSYGGFIVDRQVTAPLMLEIFDCVAEHLQHDGISRLIYKPVPHIYHAMPAEEDLYALFRRDAILQGRLMLTVVDMGNRFPFQERRKRGINKAASAGITISESGAWREFWDLLSDHLKQKFDTVPVHSLEEILLLQSRFPRKIRLFEAYKGRDLVAGTVIYETERVAHVQYVASNDNGRSTGALDLLFATLLDQIFARKRYFDFGSSNEDHGRVLNAGLIDQKCGFGGRGVVQDIYEIRI